MTRWHRYLFDPVAAARPLLFSRVFLPLLALDIWLTFIPKAPRLGAGGFDVAHFAWLDELQPTPTPGRYVAMMIVASFAALVCGICGLNRALLAIALCFYTYGWMMSHSDSFQHHYLLSLVLLCVMCFPSVKASDLKRPHTPSRPAMISAWAFVMLGTQIAIVYFWTTIAKLDANWVQGHVVEKLMVNERAMAALNDAATAAVAPEGGGLLAWLQQLKLWPALAIGAVVMEFVLAAGYVFAVQQDRHDGARTRMLCLALFGIALMLHAGIMFMPLTIGMFSGYMVLAACAFLLPTTWIDPAMRRVSAAASHVIDTLARWMNPRESKVLCFAEALVIAAGLGWLGWGVDLPGVFAGACVVALLALLLVAMKVLRNDIPAAQRCVLAAMMYCGLAGACLHGGDLQYRMNLSLAQRHHFAGDPRDAFRLYATAARHAPPHADRVALYNNIGDVMRELDDLEGALDWYQAALRIAPDDAITHAHLAVTLMTLNRHDEAIEHYQQSLRLNMDSAVSHYNLAFALQSRKRLDEAVQHYQHALQLDPDMHAAHSNLAALLLVMHRPEAAETHLRESLRLDELDVSAMNNLAWMLATRQGADAAARREALELARRAAAATRSRDPVVLGTLAEASFAAGLRDDAMQAAQQALAIAEAQQLDAVAVQIKSRLERYRAGR